MQNSNRIFLLMALVCLVLLALIFVFDRNISQNVDPRAQDGVWIIGVDVTWEVPGSVFLLDDNGHTLTGTYYRATVDGVLQLGCAMGRDEQGRMRVEVRPDMTRSC